MPVAVAASAVFKAGILRKAQAKETFLVMGLAESIGAMLLTIK